ncbi:MAG TPA: PhzF family phenazine biosynthesis protein [Thermoanaerobaculia bacterium]|nr:PhzF family phenazine biosynthesis protein [Thermoanaerobaculia bacterium]
MRFFIVDVFAERKYSGNQLGMFVLDRDAETSELQQIAKELHFSECTFVRPGLRDGGFDVRIFTPDMEVPFAGHPTLGTAFAIRELLHWSDAPTITLNLGVGQIPVAFNAGMLTMQQKQPTFGPSIDRRALEDILGVEEIDDRFPVEVVSTGLPSVIVPLTSLDALQRCRIDHERYARFLRDVSKSAILVFTPLNDIRVRVFVDDEGFFEDPATGSANGNLAAWFLRHHYFACTAIKYRVEQGFELGRPSILEIAASEEHGSYEIRVGGRVVPVAQGTLYEV